MGEKKHGVSRERQAILDLFAGRALTPREVADALGRSVQATATLLGKMKRDRQLQAYGPSRYWPMRASFSERAARERESYPCVGMGGMYDSLDHEMPAEVEKAYRRGYTQGASLAHEATVNGCRRGEIERWIYDALWPWRRETRHWQYSDIVRGVCPPDAPHVGRQAREAAESSTA